MVISVKNQHIPVKDAPLMRNFGIDGQVMEAMNDNLIFKAKPCMNTTHWGWISMLRVLTILKEEPVVQSFFPAGGWKRFLRHRAAVGRGSISARAGYPTGIYGVDGRSDELYGVGAAQAAAN